MINIPLGEEVPKNPSNALKKSNLNTVKIKPYRNQFSRTYSVFFMIDFYSLDAKRGKMGRLGVLGNDSFINN